MDLRRRYVRAVQPLLITTGGAIFPFGSIVQLRGRRWRRWDELANATIEWSEGVEFTGRDALVFRFNDGTMVKMPLQSMSHEDIEKLLVALEMWAPSNALGSFSELRSYLSRLLKAQGVPSYTALWNDELSRRFNLATFRPLPPGAKLQGGRFEITSQLSFGGFSAVYNGISSRSEQVAIKELSIAHIDSQSVKDSLLLHIEREAALLSKLRHPRICRMLDTFVEKDRQYIVLEKIPGKTLRQIVAESGPLKEAVVIELALQMAEILGYLHGHEQPVVHRDFTPDNLILRENNFLILIDFNAAIEFFAGTTGTIIGKHHYMPAEQIKGKAQESSDYYSMAGSLAFLLTGVDPRPLSQLNLKASGIEISSQLSDLLSVMTSSDLTIRPKLDQISSILLNCAR